VDFHRGNFLHEKGIDRVFRDVDHVFHYICTTTPITAKDPLFDIDTNIKGAIQVLEAARKHDIQTVVFPSSGGTIYGEVNEVPIPETARTLPINPYAISKLTIERYLDYYQRTHGVQSLILRYSNPYGELQDPLREQGVIPIFLNRIMNGEAPIIYGDGSSLRDYIYIQDLVEATIEVFEKHPRESVFNIGSGEGTSLNELISIMSQIVGREIEPQYIESKGEYLPRVILDISRIRESIGWEPRTSLQDGIALTMEWLASR